MLGTNHTANVDPVVEKVSGSSASDHVESRLCDDGSREKGGKHFNSHSKYPPGGMKRGVTLAMFV